MEASLISDEEYQKRKLIIENQREI